MMQAQYRNIGGTESLWVNHTVRTCADGVRPASSGPRSTSPAARSSTTPVQQQIYGNVGSDGLHRWMGSLAVDKHGQHGARLQRSSSTMNPDIRYDGRLATDPLNTLPQGETTMLPGGGSQAATAAPARASAGATTAR